MEDLVFYNLTNDFIYSSLVKYLFKSCHVKIGLFVSLLLTLEFYLYILDTVICWICDYGYGYVKVAFSHPCLFFFLTGFVCLFIFYKANIFNFDDTQFKEPLHQFLGKTSFWYLTSQILVTSAALNSCLLTP